MFYAWTDHSSWRPAIPAMRVSIEGRVLKKFGFDRSENWTFFYGKKEKEYRTLANFVKSINMNGTDQAIYLGFPQGSVSDPYQLLYMIKQRLHLVKIMYLEPLILWMFLHRYTFRIF